MPAQTKVALRSLPACYLHVAVVDVQKSVVVDRAIPLRLPVVQARSVKARMAVAGPGLIPRKATLELPMRAANRAPRRPGSRTSVATPLSEERVATAGR